MHCMWACRLFSYPDSFKRRTAIAHSIREQIQVLAKSLVLVDHKFDGSIVEEEELANCFLPAVIQARRIGLEAWGTFGPSLMELRDIDTDRLDKDYDRETRRKRRQIRSRRHAVLLPDRDIPRVHRSPLASHTIDPSQLIPNCIIKSVAETLAPGMTFRSNNGLFFTTSMPNANTSAGAPHNNSPSLQSTPNSKGGRRGRAAAEKAAAYISSIAADEAMPDLPLNMDPEKVGTFRCYKCGGAALMPLPLAPGTKQSDVYCENCRMYQLDLK